MADLGSTFALRDRIMLLMTLPALALGCTAKTDAPAATSGTKPEQVAAEQGSGELPTQPPSTSADEGPTDEGTDTTEASVPAPLPEGTNFCFSPSEAAELAVDPNYKDGECPRALVPTKVSARVDTWSRRTGGPWDISVPFVVSDTPDGGDARCCYAQTFARQPNSPPTRGRPLVVEAPDGARMLVPVCDPSDDPGPTRPDPWFADAGVELASVAAFAHANLELMSVGAPARLILANLRAASDELEHTRLCLSRAGRTRLGPIEAVSPRPTTIVELAERTLLEACVPETLGALAAARAAASARAEGRHADAQIRERIAHDEAGHAALAWATLRWARSLDPLGVDARLRDLEASALEVMRGASAVELALDQREVPQLWAELIGPLSASASRG